ncbi:MAG: ThiF family adenylyltransferase, partial [Pseudomonadota bacterium]|nr:ThiF family adenylyltransferase [Pseudomonadota bacterium]
MLSHSATHSISHSVSRKLEHQDIRRYSRQLLLDCIDHDGQLNLASSHAVIVGLGGLGS